MTKGLYETDKNTPGYYLSFDFALTYHGLILEVTYNYTSATFRKKKRKNIRIHLERLIESGHITKEDSCTIDDVKRMIKQRFEEIDFEKAKIDVRPFIKNPDTLNIWSKEFFLSITENLQ